MQLPERLENISAQLNIKPFSWLPSAVFFIILLITGYLGNYLKYSLFFSVDFIFGSIAVLMIVRLYGLAWGTFAAIVTSLYTLILWQHPYALIIFTLEAIFVGWGLKGKTNNLLLLDICYWLLIGIPLVWLFYRGFLGVESSSVVLIMLKQAVNGILNSLIASFLLLHLPFHKWSHRPQLLKNISFEQTLFNLLVAFVFLPALILLAWNSRDAITQQQQVVQTHLSIISQHLVEDLDDWYKQNLTELQALAEFAQQNVDQNSSEELQKITKFTYHHTFPTFQNIYVISKNSNLIAESLPVTNTAVNFPSWQELGSRQEAKLSEIFSQDPSNNSPMILQSFPIFNKSQLLGNVIGVMNGNNLIKLIKEKNSRWNLNISLLNRQKRVLSSTRTELKFGQIWDREKGEIMGDPKDGLYHWIPNTPGMPKALRWAKSFYVKQTPLRDPLPWILVTEASVAPQINYINEVYIKSLFILLVIAVIALILAKLISRNFVKPILELTKLTTNFPDKIIEQKEIIWPKSTVMEMNALSYNFQLMAISLDQKFQDSKRANGALMLKEKRLREHSKAFQELVKRKTLESEKIDQTMRDITEVVSLRSQVERVSIWLYNENRSQIYCVDLYEKLSNSHHTGTTLSVSDYPQYFHAIELGQIIAAKDAHTAPATQEFSELYLTPLRIFSILDAPIILRGQVVGVISFEQVGSQRDWALEEETFISSIADFIRLAMESNDRQEAEEALRESETQLREKALALEKTLQELQHTQAQLIQSEKMSSLGQLVAGVAHEINNPVNFISGNLTYTSDYTQSLLELMELYHKYYPTPVTEIQQKIEDMELEFIREDLPKVISSMKIGAQRIQKIVSSLRNFSRLDEAEIKNVNIHEGIDSTLLMLQNRLKGKPEGLVIEVIKNYGDLPLVECYPAALNQVFIIILHNAIDSLEEKDMKRTLSEIRENPSRICIKTELMKENQVVISITDNGMGMTETVRNRLFDPFFTTKPIGKNNGMGLSIGYQIITNRHKGALRCISAPNEGAQFIIEIPLKLTGT